MKNWAAFSREVLQGDLWSDRSTVGQEHVAVLLTAPVVAEGGPAESPARVATPRRARQTYLTFRAGPR